MNVDTGDRKQQRSFGLVMAGAISVVGLIRAWVHGGAFNLWFFYVAGAFLVLGLVAPAVLRPVLYVWLKFSEAINWVMTRVLLTVAFVFLITPGRVIASVLGKDLLKQAWLPEAETYWEEPEEQPDEFDRYLNQF